MDGFQGKVLQPRRFRGVGACHLFEVDFKEGVWIAEYVESAQSRPLHGAHIGCLKKYL
jgi:hypothetical protein